MENFYSQTESFFDDDLGFQAHSILPELMLQYEDLCSRGEDFSKQSLVADIFEEYQKLQAQIQEVLASSPIENIDESLFNSIDKSEAVPLIRIQDLDGLRKFHEYIQLSLKLSSQFESIQSDLITMQEGLDLLPSNLQEIDELMVQSKLIQQIAESVGEIDMQQGMFVTEIEDLKKSRLELLSIINNAKQKVSMLEKGQAA